MGGHRRGWPRAPLPRSAPDWPDEAYCLADCWTALDHLLAAAGTTPMDICSAHDHARFLDHSAPDFAGTLPEPFDLGNLLTIVAGPVHAATPGAARLPGDTVCRARGRNRLPDAPM